ncbi:polymorphic toxin type 15 domain-containing protein [Rhodovulum sulfidophilum]|nr:polymorphic toxin type 15 domain-containing protein [Rhodovulum sulfidophilum]MCF4116741.1 polymorphic toxin type 15 domain-containing protein [Rhodovulum sulfidophilum]
MRDNGAQRSARQDYALDLENQGFDDEEISEIMSSVDATHFLDIVAGDNPSAVGIGGSAKNRGIGRQWIREGRAEILGKPRGVCDRKV